MTDYPDTLVWLDLETTGLEPENHQILEVGVLVTDSELNIRNRRSWVVRQEPSVLGSMDDWCLRQHGGSGLIADSAASKLDPIQIESQLLGYLCTIGDNGTVPMCGASIHFDRAFLRRWMPKAHDWFYYGNLDVSSIEKVARLWYPELPPWKDRGLHRVDPDNEDAVAELTYYREAIFRETHSLQEFPPPPRPSGPNDD